MLHRIVAALIALACLLASPVRADEVDVELILAVDASTSVDEREWQAQVSGMADALQSRQFQEVFRYLHTGKLAINLLIWAGPGQQWSGGWHVIAGPKDAAAFGDYVRGSRQPFGAGLRYTFVGDMLTFARAQFAISPHRGFRRVIDIASDGILSPGASMAGLQAAREALLADGVIINALTIGVRDQYRSDVLLDDWYGEHVIGGIGSFVIGAKDFDADYARVFRRKLIIETGDLSPVLADRLIFAAR